MTKDVLKFLNRNVHIGQPMLTFTDLESKALQTSRSESAVKLRVPCRPPASATSNLFNNLMAVKLYA